MDPRIEKRLDLIRKSVSVLKYAPQEAGGITIHPTDRDNFWLAMGRIDDAAREIAILLTAEQVLTERSTTNG
jgi:hypothetical protein